MNSYEESVIESCWNVIGLWELGASDRHMGEAIENMKNLVSAGPEGFVGDSED